MPDTIQPTPPVNPAVNPQVQQFNPVVTPPVIATPQPLNQNFQAPPPPPAPQQQTVVQISADQFGEMLKQLSNNNADFVAKITSIVAGSLPQGQEQGRRRFGIRKPMDEVLIDKDDSLDTPVIFFAWGKSTNIRDDIRHGHPVSTPYNRPIRFKNLYRYKRGSGRDAEIVMICHAVVRSKKEADFIRNHTKFNYKYFEKTSQVESMSAEYSNILGMVSSEVGKMNQNSILNRAVSLGLKVTDDFAYMKKMIIETETARRYSNRFERAKIPVPVDMNNPQVTPVSPEHFQKVNQFAGMND
jgi:hypothetical protein